MITHSYPSDWKATAANIKAESNWRCNHCRAHHAPPNVVLTVHHRNGKASDCRPFNLIALCAPCHLRQQARDRHRDNLRQALRGGLRPLPLR